jgi:hypothetical protein
MFFSKSAIVFSFRLVCFFQISNHIQRFHTISKWNYDTFKLVVFIFVYILDDRKSLRYVLFSGDILMLLYILFLSIPCQSFFHEITFSNWRSNRESSIQSFEMLLFCVWIISSQVSYNMLAISSFNRSQTKHDDDVCKHFTLHSLTSSYSINVYKVVFYFFSARSILIIIEC